MTDIAIWLASVPLILGFIKTGHHFIWGTRTIKDNWLGWILVIVGLVLLGLFMEDVISYQVSI
jgi:hypothetical protein